ncbi:calcium/proton exchanger [Exophiala mesophila]|uniref:Calcium/proton exchanger n=1 Tax=Exophiala mesophila TaxID=212818 RepID=A0A0D2AAX4_EXOME|nr:calcium/proton exchanger [Exophiala mesophila]KIV96053.1 calcium/proton exchanger [Exophiala mesophila]
MVDSADEPPLLKTRLYSWAKISTLLSFSFRRKPASHEKSILPITASTSDHQSTPTDHVCNDPSAAGSADQGSHAIPKDKGQHPPPPVDQKRDGTEPSALETTDIEVSKQSLLRRFTRDVKRIIFSSWINWLLVFVPVAIILGALVDWGHHDLVSPNVIFALNAVAIIPLASLLSYATESVAIRLGDTIGALMNVTFGNAVELIIFIIALNAGEVRVVQAAALGSILSNLLLILGMCFVVGGLRFREQLYNSTVSQMSACLLCLSVISLLLPTAFHASFSNMNAADDSVLKVSRGTSVVLLLVYLLYLLFQLKSHAFMYQSTPQHLIDEESHPGVLADILNASSTSSDTSSSSSSDTDSSSGSQTTAKRFRRALRRKRRKSTSSTKDNISIPAITTSSSNLTVSGGLLPQNATSGPSAPDTVLSGDEADVDVQRQLGRRHSRANTVYSRDFESQPQSDHVSTKSKKSRKKHRKFNRAKKEKDKDNKPAGVVEDAPVVESRPGTDTDTFLNPTHLQVPHVIFAPDLEAANDDSTKHPFNIRNLSEAVRPAFNSTNFPHHQAMARPLAIPIRPPSRAPSSPRPVRRTSSMPDILHRTSSSTRIFNIPPPSRPLTPVMDPEAEVEAQGVVEQPNLSRTSAIVMLLASTAMVALCAEFLVGSIDHLVASTDVSQAFIGLIILPVVGNAAEHVTAVTVAAKNKMDLAINIALGSSIQIALFVTPFMVILGWILKTEMSLYFSLFETVSLFASAFIVSFLMIDGRSNYLEGALLIAAYVIIAVAAFYYPKCDLSDASGPVDASLASC